MIAATLSSVLDRRAGEFLAAAQFSGSPETVRAASVLGVAASVAQDHGIAGVEGYLIALEHLGTGTDITARRMIRAATDEAISTVAFAAWSGRLGEGLDALPATASPVITPLAA